ncbi:MAG: ABC transporter substrate-binding protein [Chitinophagales bacterium]
MKVRRLLAIGLLLAVVALVPVTVSAAEKVVVYTTLDEDLARAVIAEFQKDTGIQVEWVRLSSGEVNSRLVAEKARPQADVWWGAPAVNHIAAKLDGVTAPYVSPAAEKQPEKFRDKDHYWHGLYVGPLGFATNTDFMKAKKVAAPTSWNDLLKPEFTGMVQVSNPASSGTAYTVLATLVQIMGEDKAFAYLKQLNKQVSQYPSSGSKPATNAGLGECGVGISFAQDIVGKVIEKGYPVKLTFPKEGIGVEVAAVSLVKGAPHPEAAKKLIEWAISTKAQKMYAATKCWPISAGVKLSEELPELSELPVIPFDHKWAGDNHDRLVERWQKEVYGK